MVFLKVYFHHPQELVVIINARQISLFISVLSRQSFCHSLTFGFMIFFFKNSPVRRTGHNKISNFRRHARHDCQRIAAVYCAIDLSSTVYSSNPLLGN